jgi:hypothetical protein
MLKDKKRAYNTMINRSTGQHEQEYKEKKHINF